MFIGSNTLNNTYHRHAIKQYSENAVLKTISKIAYSTDLKIETSRES